MTAVASTWVAIGRDTDIPPEGARVVRTGVIDVAVFRTAAGEVLAIEDRCPHRDGPLSQGIVHGEMVTCPLHNWVISLRDGKAQGADEGCVRTIPTRVVNGVVYLAAAAIAKLTAA